ncbi:hypothetical protein Pcaca03_02960 [Pectobacterium carotovorum subsp. carotovorum]|uniref:Uncharacterized protein n=1 Tax=Pectobacterium carotovorum subsp. carotovorum TaxID=555 RepID=A0AAI9KXD5_PECCC|nr:hypothetical protein SOASR016_02960 [Pectobacterium carotovorum subsp. carotovorum]GLV67852.1 hypothetical protein Pcaca03_02960 [Pectobacterium carotovorum subsp. carotovorum]
MDKMRLRFHVEIDAISEKDRMGWDGMGWDYLSYEMISILMISLNTIPK